MKTNATNNHITFMSDEEAMNRVPMLMNLMVLPEVIDDGVTVYNVDADCTIELVPLLKEASKEIQSLLYRAKIDIDIEDGSVPVLGGEPTNLLNLLTLANVISSDATVYDEDGDATVQLVPTLEKAAEEYEWLQDRIDSVDREQAAGDSEDNTYGTRFVDQMVARKREMIDTFMECERIKAEASKKFADWLSTAVADATPLEIAEVADYDGDGITHMDKLAVMAGRVFLDVGQENDKK